MTVRNQRHPIQQVGLLKKKFCSLISILEAVLHYDIFGFMFLVLSGKSKSNSNISGKHKISSCVDMNLCSNYYIQAIIIVLVFVISVWYVDVFIYLYFGVEFYI